MWTHVIDLLRGGGAVLFPTLAHYFAFAHWAAFHIRGKSCGMPGPADPTEPYSHVAEMSPLLSGYCPRAAGIAHGPRAPHIHAPRKIARLWLRLWAWRPRRSGAHIYSPFDRTCHQHHEGERN